MGLWFDELEGESLKLSYKIKNVLFHDKSAFQSIKVVDTEAYGRMLLIDDLVMITEADEFVYHEMITHIPSFIHGAPKNVIVIGGGDGGVVRELLKHDSVENITLCEIDSMVVDVSKKFFPHVASGLEDSRVNVHFGDGIAYIKEQKESSVDLIIVDSTDPIGPGEVLFTKDFYYNVARVLSNDGIMACQSESPWYDDRIHQMIQGNIGSAFSFKKSYLGTVPTYPRGVWSWTLASQSCLDPDKVTEERLSKLEDFGLKYLNKKIFSASFALPNFFLDKIKVDNS